MHIAVPGAAAADAPSLPVAKAAPISEQLSFNYSVAKVLSIAMVVLGHWTGSLYGLPLWIPVTFGLFLFAFSSGFFTAAIYGAEVDRGRFWRRKLQRLGVRFWVILAFIAVVVAVQGKDVLHWHSLLHAAGLSGAMNWFGIRNHSPLGAGLWFFTLLLLFYVAYPTLARLARSRALALLMLGGGFVAAIVLQEHVKVGHELWLTAYAFIAGVACRMQALRVPAALAGAAAILLCAALFGLNGIGIKDANTILIAASSLAIALWLVAGRVPHWPGLPQLARQEKYLLEVFLIHTYLFVRPTGHAGIDFGISLALIMAASYAVGRAGDALAGRLFGGRG